MRLSDCIRLGGAGKEEEMRGNRGPERVLRGGILGLLAAAPASAGTLWVVDDDGGAGVDFLEIQPAVDAAGSGDVVLVKAGDYSTVFIQGKGVTVIAEANEAVRIDETVLVSDLPLGETVILRGLDVRGSLISTALVVRNTIGTVWVEDCNLEGGLTGAFLSDGRGAFCEDADNVVFSRCAINGAAGFFSAGADGLRSTRSVAYVGQSVTVGGDGVAAAPGLAAGIGAPGLMLTDGLLVAAGSVALGGAGGAGAPPPSCTDGGAGGEGALLKGVFPLLRIADSYAVGGAGGSATAPCVPGAPGGDVVVDAGGIEQLLVGARSFQASSPVRDGESTRFELGGLPGELGFVLMAHAPRALPKAVPEGTLLIEDFVHAEFVGALGPDGTLAYDRPLPPQVGLPGPTVLHLQAAFANPIGTVVLGEASVLIVLE